VSVQYYTMKPGQEPQVTALIQKLIADYGTDFTSKISPESLRSSAGFLNVEVAEKDGRIVGICCWVMSFSTWRGVKGMHVADHFILPEVQSSTTARDLLRVAARNAANQGATFIRTEIDITDEFIESVFGEIGFWHQTRHTLHFLEPIEFQEFIKAD
jgi:hypothetical protein